MRGRSGEQWFLDVWRETAGNAGASRGGRFATMHTRLEKDCEGGLLQLYAWRQREHKEGKSGKQVQARYDAGQRCVGGRQCHDAMLTRWLVPATQHQHHRSVSTTTKPLICLGYEFGKADSCHTTCNYHPHFFRYPSF